MEKYVKNLPIEAFVLLFPSLFIGFLLVLLQAPFSVFLSDTLSRGIVGYILGNQMFVTIAGISAAYGIAKIIAMGLKREYFQRETLLQYGRSFFFIAAIVILVSAFQSGMIYQLFINADISRIISVGGTLMNIDHSVTGIYPPLFFSAPVPIEKLLIGAFTAVSFLTPLLLAILFLLNKNLFRRFLLNFFLLIFISIPLWTFFPALSPQLMYRDNILSVEIPKSVMAALSNRDLSPFLSEFLLKQKFLAIDPTLQSLPVATFPSFQGALSVLVAFYAFALSPILGIIAIVWLLLSLAGGIYTEQYYLISTIAALVIGGISIAFVKIILEAEKKYYTDRYSLFYLLEKVADDTKRLLNFLQRRKLDM